ncbi:hypothetical protein [Pseudomonas protegens]|uniref:hypothetical protein n=1 Tax=Pseudomonas protegens TaxID=380021 RepID=UPI00320A4EE4
MQEKKPQLLDLLAARVEKRRGGDRSVLDTDASLHQQSIDEIRKLRNALRQVTDCLNSALTSGSVQAAEAAPAVIKAMLLLSDQP